MISSIIINKPVITERSLKDAQNGIFTFKAALKSNKIEVAKEIERLFKVHVAGITSEIIKGKKKFVGKKRAAKYGKDTKKVRVKLVKGEKIDLFEIGGK